MNLANIFTAFENCAIRMQDGNKTKRQSTVANIEITAKQAANVEVKRTIVRYIALSYFLSVRLCSKQLMQYTGSAKD